MKNTERLISVMQRMRGFEVPRGPLRNAELSIPQFAVLAMIGQEPGCKVTGLAERMELSAPTVSVAVRKLEDDDWLERQEDPLDARVTRLYLSKKGKRILQKIHQRRNKLIDHFLGRLDEAEQEQLLSLLEKAIVGNLAEKETSRRNDA